MKQVPLITEWDLFFIGKIELMLESLCMHVFTSLV